MTTAHRIAPADNPPVFPTIAEFEALAVDPDNFNHAAHLYVAWSMLCEYSVIDALQRYTSALRRLTAKLGVPGKYHETLTGSLILLIAERMESEPNETWSAFVRRNPDLLDNPKSVLLQYYSDERLFSAPARQQFRMPDRSPQH